MNVDERDERLSAALDRVARVGARLFLWGREVQNQHRRGVKRPRHIVRTSLNLFREFRAISSHPKTLIVRMQR